MATTEEVTVPHAPALATIRDVPILEVGHWERLSTGPVDFAPEDLAAAVDALDDPAISRPYIRLGHTDRRFTPGDGEPAVGYLQNVRLGDEGMTVYADLVGIPAWLAEVMASAFPNRSIDGAFGYRTSTGNTHRFIIQGLALLGIYWPGIETLEDIATLYGVAARADAQPESTAVTVDVGVPEGAYVAAIGHHGATVPGVPSRRVSASVSTEDIRRAYYDSLTSAQSWWWVREINLDPYELIVCDDDDQLLRVPFAVSGADITFEDPVPVRVVYVDASTAPRPRAVTVYATRGQSRPEGVSMDIAALRQSLGLADDVSDDDVLARAAEVAAEREADRARIAELEAQIAADPPAEGDGDESEDGGSGSTVPEGAVLIDAAALTQLQTQARQGAEAAATLRTQERDRFIAEVRGQGRLTAASAALQSTLEREWDRDPEAARKTAAALAVVAPTTPAGHGGPGDVTDEDALYQSLYGQEAK